jgi:hypothetical protein
MERRLPRGPRCASVSQLLVAGLLSEADIRADGSVNELSRVLAEAEYTRIFPPGRRGDAPPPRRARAAGARASDASRDALRTCCVCLAAERQYAFVPCYHLCVCAACAVRVSRCPLCRGPKVDTQRVFLG